ncbi:MAG: glutathione S-transferase family protein [Halioglobus sp.]
MDSSKIIPANLYGSSISYFTGKLENYFRIKGLPYELRALTSKRHASIMEKVGSTQMPALELADGRWMSDSTPIIQWFEEQYPATGVIPIDPLQRFFSLLLEDYADEWLWRPAMHFRWFYDRGARFASTQLAEELMSEMPLPGFIKRRMLIYRQRNGYTRGDGITPNQVPGVEAIYFRTLDQLEAIFQKRPFLLGENPSLADIGFSGPFFRHFALDPVPAELMRQRAPAVYEWTARLWNAKLEEGVGTQLEGIPADWGPILDEIGSNYLPYLCGNIEALIAGQKKFDVEVDGVQYTQARWSKYRVWCLKQIRARFEALDTANQEQAKALLEKHGCWEPMWRHADLPIDENVCKQLPFYVDEKMIDVYE